jgi:hypothetical protein
MNAPWLFAEAYKYRRLRECFSLSKYWVDYGELRKLLSLRKNAHMVQTFSSVRSAILSPDLVKPFSSSLPGSLNRISTTRVFLTKLRLRRTSSSSWSLLKVSDVR